MRMNIVDIKRVVRIAIHALFLPPGAS